MAVSASRNQGRNRERRDGPAFVDDLLAMAGSLANSRKEYASAQLESLADSVRQFADGLAALPTVKTYAATAADSLEELAGYVLDSDLPDIVSDARDLARRHPFATFGGSVIAGLVLTQFVQSRADQVRTSLRGTSRLSAARSGRRPGQGAGQDA